MKKIVPFHEVPQELLQAKAEQLSKNGHRPFYAPDGSVAGFISPFSASRHVAQVEVDAWGNIIGFDFDQIERTDGAMNVNEPWGHATPNAMVVVIEKTGWWFWRKYWVHSVVANRPFIYDHRTEVKGVEVVDVGGGWANKLGKDPRQTALDTLMADSGIEVNESSMRLVGYHTSNRAWCETIFPVYLAMFSRQFKPLGGTHDQTKIGPRVRLDKFPVGMDALVNSAIAMVKSALHSK